VGQGKGLTGRTEAYTRSPEDVMDGRPAELGDDAGGDLPGNLPRLMQLVGKLGAIPTRRGGGKIRIRGFCRIYGRGIGVPKGI
jgi:hypothetical protein